jgi:type 1 glutamine amidotransferase
MIESMRGHCGGMLGVILAACVLFGASPTACATDADKPLKVCLVSGSLEYKSSESLEEFQKYLEANYPVRCSRAFIVGNDEEHLPGLENLDDCDVMLLFTRRLKLSGDDLERIKRYCTSGRPIVGVRTASHAIQSWLDLDKEVLGGNYHGHYEVGPETEITIPEAAKKHPVLAGVRPYRSAASLYKNEGLSSDVDILMTGAISEHTEPIAWTRAYKGGRIFYTSLGHPQDFGEESFRRLLANALFWSAGRGVPAK